MDATLKFSTLREVEKTKIFNLLSNFTVKDDMRIRNQLISNPGSKVFLFIKF